MMIHPINESSSLSYQHKDQLTKENVLHRFVDTRAQLPHLGLAPLLVWLNVRCGGASTIMITNVCKHTFSLGSPDIF